MTDMSDGRVPAAQEAMKKTPEELVTWAVERTHDDSLRQSIVQLEFARKALPLRTGLQRRRRKPPSTRKPMLATCCGQ